MHVIYNDGSILSKYSENARSVYINIFRTGNVLNYHIVHFLDMNTFLIHNRKFERGVACNSKAAFCANHETRGEEKIENLLQSIVLALIPRSLLHTYFRATLISRFQR